MNLARHLNKNNLHHAYLVEGEKDKVVPEILQFCESLDIKTSGNPDFCHIAIDNFKMEEALNLRSMGNDKSFSPGKKIFIICSNSFTLDAQGTLLKMFEEPIENTHFFLVVPDTNALLKTLVSRFYVISARQDLATKDAEEFINMPLQNRLDFVKELLPKKDVPTPEGVGIPTLDEDRDVGKEFTESNSAKALKFLNALETVLHNKMSKAGFDIKFLEHFFKVRKFLRMPGSSAKTLMESVALIVPGKL